MWCPQCFLCTHVPVLPRVAVNLEQKDLPSVYKSMDAFVLPTRGEGWGRPIVEAMSMALPVLVTNFSGPTEFLTADNSYPVQYNLRYITDRACSLLHQAIVVALLFPSVSPAPPPCRPPMEVKVGGGGAGGSGGHCLISLSACPALHPLVLRTQRGRSLGTAWESPVWTT
jgi:hypothetical protein